MTYAEAQALRTRVVVATKRAMAKSVNPPPGLLAKHADAINAIKAAYMNPALDIFADGAVATYEAAVEAI
jgi:hypothetical protein